jgi:hypothetical protein
MKLSWLISAAALASLLCFSSLPASAANTFTAAPNPVAPGQTVTFTGNIDAGVTATNVKVDLWMYNSAGTKVGVGDELGVSFTAGQTTPVTIKYAVPSSTPKGTYTYNLNFYNGSDGSALAGAENQADDGSYMVGTSTNPLSKVCASAVVVGLQWTPVSGAVTYNIYRNGTKLTTSPISYTYYNDQTVAASTSYTYMLTALNSSGGTVSNNNLAVTTSAASANGDPAYCPSSVISGMTWNWSSGFNQQDGSDIWAQTWGGDGKEYTFFGDGGGFFGSDTNGRASFGIAEISGSTAGVINTSTVSNVFGGLNAAFSSTINGKASSLIAINSDFYAIGSVYQSGDSGGPSGAPPHVEIEYSLGNAYTWTSNFSNWVFCNSATASNAFCPGSFVEFGAGNNGAIDNYVYIYGTTKQTEVGTSPNSYLARVPNNEILTKSAYQLFGGLDSGGNPIWNTPNSTWSNMQPAFTDRGPNPLNIGAPAYNPGLNRYIAVALGNFVNQAAFYEAPNPWGPWRSIGYYNSTPTTGGWGNLGDSSFTNGHGDSIGINFINKWTSSNGKTMWAVFSSDGTAGNAGDLVPLRGLDMDSFNLVSVTLSTP